MSETTTSSGIGFLGLLSIVFITLKLLGKIDWSWMIVLAPLWMPWAIALSILFCAGCFYLFLRIMK